MYCALAKRNVPFMCHDVHVDISAAHCNAPDIVWCSQWKIHLKDELPREMPQAAYPNDLTTSVPYQHNAQESHMAKTMRL